LFTIEHKYNTIQKVVEASSKLISLYRLINFHFQIKFYYKKHLAKPLTSR